MVAGRTEEEGWEGEEAGWSEEEGGWPNEQEATWGKEDTG
jgi:hypothetical protein